jgi:hypothetical protein
MKRPIALLLAALATSCGPTTMMMTALEPAPASTIVRRPSPKTFTLVAGVGEDPECVQTGQIGVRYCFLGFRAGFERATEKALSGLLTPSKTAMEADYRAEVKTLSLNLGSDHGYTTFVIPWSFEIVDRSGRVVVTVHDEFVGGAHIDYSGPLPDVLKEMQDGILDQIVGAVAQSEAVQP